jgi:hypothetical protein
MWSVICTGTNLNYGKAGERRLISNDHVKGAVREGYVINPRYAGSGRLVIKEYEAKK